MQSSASGCSSAPASNAADEQATALLARDPAAHVHIGARGSVAFLPDSLQKAGAHDQVAALVDRLPSVGMFELVLNEKGLADKFRFGREADSTAAASWGWEDLDLWPKRQTESEQPRRLPAV